MHLKRVLALLLSEIPDLNDAIDACSRNLNPGVEPGSFDKRLGVALESRQTLSRSNVPHFAGFVTGRRD